MSHVRPRVSYADLERWPEDGRRYELYDGEVFVMPAPTFRHQRVAVNLVLLLHEHERSESGRAVVAPFDIVLSQHNVVQPDVVYFVRDRVQLLEELGPARIPPDLAVEVLSPGTLANDRGRKMRLLARFGVREYWLVDPVQNTLERYVLEADAYVLDAVVGENDAIESRVLPTLKCPASRVFEA